MTKDGQKSSPNQLYGRRKGPRLRAHQAGLVDNLLPKLRVDPGNAKTTQPGELFAAGICKVWLEVGFGGGEHLAWQASNNPDIGMLGCEPFINGIAKLLTAIENDGLANIRIFDGDARELLPGLDDGVIERVFVLFPDPWPKRRHHKRRFINQDTLSELHRVMKPGSQLRIASDINDYIRWTLFAIRRHGGFEWLAETAGDWRERPCDWPPTRYEAKAVREGRTPCYLKFRRLP